MALYRYVKKSQKPILTQDQFGLGLLHTVPRPGAGARLDSLTGGQNSKPRLLPIFLIIIGLGLFASVAYPVFSYQIFATSRFQPKLLSPLADSVDLSPVVFGEEKDLTKLSNWFSETIEQTKPSSKITHYTISIPKLGIFEATVKIGGEDLKESLIHYGGAALPGEFGNTVIFGHSVLPQFFNPKNYLTIFSTLPTLESGDEAFVSFDGIEYKYKVYEMIEVDPSDVSLLEQRYDNSYLTLVTCVPPGTYWKRLGVRAKLEKI